MADSDLLAPFDDDVIERIAAENGVDGDLLRETLRDHQRTMRDNPGVENLVYEWRKQFDDAVLDRTPDTYVVGVRREVWDEFGEYLDVPDYLLAATIAVHQEQTLRRSGVELDGLDEADTVVVVARPA